MPLRFVGFGAEGRAVLGFVWTGSSQCEYTSKRSFPVFSLLFPHSHIRAASTNTLSAQHPGVLSAPHCCPVNGHPLGLLDVSAPQAPLRAR